MYSSIHSPNSSHSLISNAALSNFFSQPSGTHSSESSAN